MGAKKRHDTTYLASRKWMLDPYNVAAATNPAACTVRVVDASGAPAGPSKNEAPQRKPKH